MTTAILTPQSRGDARPAGGRIWRKRLLPVGAISYKGRRIDFTRDYNDGLAAAFRAGSHNQVPFQLAGDENKHTNAVERFGGQVLAMDSGPDGLWITLEATEDSDKILRTNPGLGVSARIVEEYERATDGKQFPAAVQHVLGTLDPRLTGLGPWQSVSLSNDGIDMIIDLSDSSYDDEEGDVPGLPEMTDQQKANLTKLLDVEPGQLDALLASLTEGVTASEPEGDDDELTDAELDALVAEFGDLTPEQLAMLEEAEGETEPEEEPVAAGASLSQEHLLAIELANARADQTEAQLATVQAKLDKDSYENERRKLAEDFGIPPYITDLARPVLEGAGHTIELANGNSADAGAIVRKVLTELGKMGKMLDLSGELGSPLDLSADGEGAEQAAQSRSDLINRYRSQVGI